MIIRFPTGLYKTVLPQGEESGNVTYTISNQDPPRPTIRTLPLPVLDQITPLPPALFSELDRRTEAGELVFTLLRSGRSNPGSNIKQFEPGQTLEFGDDLGDPVTGLRLPDSVSIQHNTNILDLEAAGLTVEEVQSLTTDSITKKMSLERELTALKVEVNDLEVSIRENQKKLNETNKAINAVREVFDIPINDLDFDNDIYQKLLVNKTMLESERSTLISDLNAKIVETEETHRSLLRVSELVR